MERCAPHHRRFEGDDGAVFAEFALLLPLLAILALGTYEYGMAFHEQTTVAGALRAAARVGASSSDIANNRPADLYAIQAFSAAIAGTKRITVNRFVIYKSTGSDGAPTNTSCLTTNGSGSGTGVPGACNIYVADQVTSPGANFVDTCTGGAGTAWDRYWCPTDRKTRQSDPPDYVGYYANVTYESMTKILPTTVVITDKFVARIDPKVTS